MLTISRPGLPSAGNGYSSDDVTHSLPLASKAIFIGLAISGSLATSCASNPDGSLKHFFSSSGVFASVGATTGGSSARIGGRPRVEKNRHSASKERRFMVVRSLERKQAG